MESAPFARRQLMRGRGQFDKRPPPVGTTLFPLQGQAGILSTSKQKAWHSLKLILTHEVWRKVGNKVDSFMWGESYLFQQIGVKWIVLIFLLGLCGVVIFSLHYAILRHILS